MYYDTYSQNSLQILQRCQVLPSLNKQQQKKTITKYKMNHEINARKYQLKLPYRAGKRWLRG